jgi:DNA-binding transcriptional regulator YhcF (GntR family)
MRGFLAPALKVNPTESQKRFQALSRGRRVKLARAAKTTLVKADQWARGESRSADVSTALDHAVTQLGAKKK